MTRNALASLDPVDLDSTTPDPADASPAPANDVTPDLATHDVQATHESSPPSSRRPLPPVQLALLAERLEHTRLFHEIMREYHRWARRFGLTPARFEALGYIEGKELSMSQRELSILLKVAQPSTSRLVSRMARDGLLTILERAEDRRAHVYQLTEEGRRRLRAAKLAFTGPLPPGFVPVQFVN